MIMQFKI